MPVQRFFGQMRALRDAASVMFVRGKKKAAVAKKKKGWCDGLDHPTMSDLPVPEGSWNDWYQDRIGRYNMYLALSGASLIGVLGYIQFYIKSSGINFFNFSPPEHYRGPGEEEEEKEEDKKGRKKK